MTEWYCTTIVSSIVARSKEGLLIRGVDEKTIFVVSAKTKWDACNKAAEIINKTKTITR